MTKRITAIVNFTFDFEELNEEAMSEIMDRIKNGEYFPSDVVELELIPA
jgi:hypothetical protein